MRRPAPLVLAPVAQRSRLFRRRRHLQRLRGSRRAAGDDSGPPRRQPCRRRRSGTGQLDTVREDIETLRGSAAELEPEVDALQASVEAVEASVTSVSTPPEQATALVSSLSDVDVAWEALKGAAGSECD